MICARCGEAGAGLRYRAWWFHPMCWWAFRLSLTLGESERDAETILAESAKGGVQCGADAPGVVAPDAPVSREEVASHD